MSQKTIEITYEDQQSKGRYVARIPGVEGEGELTISKVSDTLIIADHTAVPDTMRGSGAGKALALRLVEDARAKGQRIMPLCPFVRAQSLRHPEWADVIQH
ncbi:GNAT family N-acetyltransferase [Oceanicella sp. SM1341]|uniref:GNAT family N-acetyltransferase n=1 Tax=Oceanicella sp. SM1341 TaxID=1548889 RepID=UPI000E49A49E|nr:GNAT family N-acetyltransferase [Oceanicella sp. SM1341]